MKTRLFALVVERYGRLMLKKETEPTSNASPAGCGNHLLSNTETKSVLLGKEISTKKPSVCQCSTGNQCCQGNESADTPTA